MHTTKAIKKIKNAMGGYDLFLCLPMAKRKEIAEAVISGDTPKSACTDAIHFWSLDRIFNRFGDWDGFKDLHVRKGKLEDALKRAIVAEMADTLEDILWDLNIKI